MTRYDDQWADVIAAEEAAEFRRLTRPIASAEAAADFFAGVAVARREAGVR